MNDSSAPSDVASSNVVTTPAESRASRVPKRSPLLPFFFANLVAVYLPGVLPTAMKALSAEEGGEGRFRRVARASPSTSSTRRMRGFGVQLQLGDGKTAADCKTACLCSPLGWEIGSFYTMLFGLWFVVLGLSIGVAQRTAPLVADVFLFVLFTLQAIVVARPNGGR